MKEKKHHWNLYFDCFVNPIANVAVTVSFVKPK